MNLKYKDNTFFVNSNKSPSLHTYTIICIGERIGRTKRLLIKLAPAEMSCVSNYLADHSLWWHIVAKESAFSYRYEVPVVGIGTAQELVPDVSR